MGIRENKVEKYLKEQTKKLFNGESRKWVSPGHVGVYDQILFIPNIPLVMVEVKTKDDGKISSVQRREQQRLRETKAVFLSAVVHGHDEVDMLMNDLRKYIRKNWMLNC